MEKVRILAIAPYAEMAEIMERVGAQQSRYTLNVQIGNINTFPQVVARVPPDSYDVIVSRGGTAKQLRKAVAAPVVEITVSVYEALRSLRMAEGYVGKFAVVGFSNITECVTQLAALLRYRLDVFTLETPEDIPLVLGRLRQENYEMILCDTVCAQLARKEGLNVLLIMSDENSIAAAFDRACHIALANQGIRIQNQLLRRMLTANGDDFIVFSPQGSLLCSSLNDGQDGLLEWVQGMLPRILANQHFCHHGSFDGRSIHLHGRQLPFGDETVCTVQICYPDSAACADGSGVMILNSSDVSQESAALSDLVYVGDFKRLVEQYAHTSFPVLLLGEPGTGKDEVCSLLYRQGPFHQSPMAVIDCRLTTPKQWRFLLNHEHSPLMQSGITISIRNIQCLSHEDAGALFALMHHTNLCRRNRILFSQIIQPASEGRAGEGCYAQDYIQGHFSSVVLHLPSLRSYPEQIPNIAILSLNQLNLSLGTHLIGFDPAALELLQQYEWPDNLAQLRRVIRTLTITADSLYISAASVARLLEEERRTHPAPVQWGFSLDRTLDEINYEIICQVMRRENNNQRRTAEVLGISRSTLWRVLKSKTPPPYCGPALANKKENLPRCEKME